MLATLLAAAIALLFTLIGIVAVLAIADSLRKARNAYARLMHEAALMQANLAVADQAAEMPVQSAAIPQLPAPSLPVLRAPVQPMPQRRSSGLRIQPLLARPVPAYAV